jgi:hypothetical protein
MSRPSSAAQSCLGLRRLGAAFRGRSLLRHLLHHATRRRTHLLPRARTPMLQSDSRIKTLGDLPALAVNFFALQRRYGAGVSTSGSQPENPGSIPGTATKLSRLISSASHARKNRVHRAKSPSADFCSIIPNPVSRSRHLLSLLHATNQKFRMFPLPGHTFWRDAPDPLPQMQRFSVRPLRSATSARNRRTRRHRQRCR